MTPASEIIVRWYFEEEGADDQFINDLVATLYDGFSRNEVDSKDLLDRVISTALQTEKDEPWNSIIEVASKLHFALISTDRDMHNLDMIALISDAVENMPNSPIAKRITIMKIGECIARLKG